MSELEPGSGGASAADALLEAARQAADRAYSPYSEVRVGAALLTREGRVHTACNVENASYGLTLCAERSAVVKAVSEGDGGPEGDGAFEAVAIWSDREALLMPCGACRQVLHEFAPGLRVLVASAGGGRREFRLDELLPGGMGREDLG